MIRGFWRRSLLALVVAGSLLSLSGCVYLVIGGVGALGGYAISPDTVEGNITDTSSRVVWEAAVKTASVMGVLLEKNDISLILIARVHNTQVTVSVEEKISGVVTLRVKARMGMMPKIKLAQDVYTKIVHESAY